MKLQVILIKFNLRIGVQCWQKTLMISINFCENFRVALFPGNFRKKNIEPPSININLPNYRIIHAPSPTRASGIGI